MLPKAQLILRKFQPFTPCCWSLFFLYFVLLSFLRIYTEIASTSPAPSLSSPKFRACSSPLQGGPNLPVWVTPGGQQVYSPSTSATLFSMRGDNRGTPVTLVPPEVLTPARRNEFSCLPAPAEHHSSASQNTCPQFSKPAALDAFSLFCCLEVLGTLDLHDGVGL